MVIHEAADGKPGAPAVPTSWKRRFLTTPVVMMIMHSWLPVLLQVRRCSLTQLDRAAGGWPVVAHLPPCAEQPAAHRAERLMAE
jgi:hypothetical protein